MTEITIIIRPIGQGVYETRLEGSERVLCRSVAPMYAAARLLAAHAVRDPGVMLYARYEGSDQWAMRGLLRGMVMKGMERLDRKRGDELGWVPWQTKR
jgi:hypothetical protein